MPEEKTLCHVCFTPNSTGTEKCINCEVTLTASSSTIVCNNCHMSNTKNNVHCVKCGVILDDEKTIDTSYILKNLEENYERGVEEMVMFQISIILTIFIGIVTLVTANVVVRGNAEEYGLLISILGILIILSAILLIAYKERYRKYVFAISALNIIALLVYYYPLYLFFPTITLIILLVTIGQFGGMYIDRVMDFF